MSSSPPSFSKICYFKVCVCWKIGKKIFLSKLILYLLRQEYSIYFSFLTYIFTRYLRNIHEKNFGSTQITSKKSFRPTNYPQEKIGTHEIPTKRYFGPTKYPREKNYGPTKARWHNGTRPTRSTMARDPRNLAHQSMCCVTMCWI